MLSRLFETTENKISASTYLCLYGQLKDADLRRDNEMNGQNRVPNKWFSGVF